MKKNLRDVLDDWPRYFIRDSDLAWILKKTDDARYSLVKRSLKSGVLTRFCKGLYLITSKTKQILPDEFELALFVYEPSFISLESALSYHGWIPEAVYTTTCVSPKRAQKFETPLGIFSYRRVPVQNFYLGVSRFDAKTGIIFIADPWRALADFMYTYKRSWESLLDLEVDLRIDYQTVLESDKELLEQLSNEYPSPRVRKNLKIFLDELMK